MPLSEDLKTKTLSIPEAGKLYFGLSRGSSYSAAERGELPFIQIGRLKRVPVAKLEAMLEAAGSRKVEEI